MSDPFGIYNSGVTFDARRPTPTPSPPPPVAIAQPVKPPNQSTKQSGSIKSKRDENQPNNQTHHHTNPQTIKQPTPRKAGPVVQPPASVLKEGFLEKKISTAILPSWHSRYFLLTPQSIWYYDDDTTYQMHGKPSKIIEIQKSTYIMDEGDKGDRLEIVSQGKTIHVRAASKDEMQEWKAAILSVIERVKSGTSFAH